MAKKWSKEARKAQSERMKAKWGGKESLLEAVGSSTKPIKPVIDDSIKQWEEDMLGQRYIAKREFDYTDNIRFELGEIVEMAGMPNDEKLIRLGYVLPWAAKKQYESECIKCGKTFGHTAGYSKHVAMHYDVCSFCNNKVPPENYRSHVAAHEELAKV